MDTCLLLSNQVLGDPTNMAPEEVNNGQWQLGRLQIHVVTVLSYFILPLSPRYPSAIAQLSMRRIAHAFNATILFSRRPSYRDTVAGRRRIRLLSAVHREEDRCAQATGTSSFPFNEVGMGAIPGSRTIPGASLPRDNDEAMLSAKQPTTSGDELLIR